MIPVWSHRLLFVTVFHRHSFGTACGEDSRRLVHPYARTVGTSFHPPCTKYYAHPAPVISRRVGMKVRFGCPCLILNAFRISIVCHCACCGERCVGGCMADDGGAVAVRECLWRKPARFLSISPHYYTKTLKSALFRCGGTENQRKKRYLCMLLCVSACIYGCICLWTRQKQHDNYH